MPRAAAARASWLEQAWLAGLFAVAAALRLSRLDLMPWYADTARDVTTAFTIARGETWPLLGPSMTQVSAHLGPLYYYVLAAILRVHADPVAPLVVIAVAGLASVVLVFRLAERVAGRFEAGCAAALYGVFPFAVGSARVLWNPGLVPCVSLVLLWALDEAVLRGRSRAVPLAMAALAVLLQLHISTVSLLLVAVTACLLWRPRIARRDFLLGAALAVLISLPYLASEATHAFANTRQLLQAVAADQAGGGARPYGEAARYAVLLSLPIAKGAPAEPTLIRWFHGAAAIHAAEVLLGAAGIAVTAWQAARPSLPREMRRRHALLLLWLAAPVLFLGSLKGGGWWYYLDVMQPAQFIAMAAALAACRAATARLVRVRAWQTLVAVAVTGAVGWQALSYDAWLGVVARRGEIPFDTASCWIGSRPAPVDPTRMISYRHFQAVLDALTGPFGLGPEALRRQVHWAVLGSPEETQRLWAPLVGAAPEGARTSRHYLVTRDPQTNGLAHARAFQVDPYVIVEYEPRIADRSWAVPSGALPATLAGRLPGDGAPLRVSVRLVSDQPIRQVQAEVDGRSVPMASVASQRHWQYDMTEVVLELPAADAPRTLRLRVDGDGALTGFEVFELPALGAAA